MSGDYISREALKQALTDKFKSRIGASRIPTWNDAFDAVTNLPPAADVVKVVRCRDCKHYDCEDGDQKCVKDAEWSEEEMCYYGFISYHGPEFFCADGERKDGGQEPPKEEA